VYLWLGRRPTATDAEDSESVVAGTANARLTAAKICAMQTTLAYCAGMLSFQRHDFKRFYRSLASSESVNQSFSKEMAECVSVHMQIFIHRDW